MIRLRNGVMWSVMGTVSSSLSQWVILILIVKIGGVSDVGVFSLGMAISAPVIMFVNMRMRQVQASDSHSEFSFKDYFVIRVVFSIVGIFVICGYSIYMLNDDVANIVIAIACIKVLESYSHIVYGYYQQKERMDKVGMSLILKSILSVACFGIALSITKNLLASVIALGGSWLFLLLFHDLRGAIDIYGLSRERTKNYSVNFLRRVRRLLKSVYPLAFVGFLWSFSSNLPKYYIQQYLGEYELGIYSSIGYFVVAGLLLVAAISQPFIPRLARYYMAGDVQNFNLQLKKLYAVTMVLGMLGIFVSLVIGNDVLAIIFSPEYERYSSLFIVMMLSGLFSYMIMVNWCALTAMKKYWAQLWMAIASFIILNGSLMTLTATSSLNDFAMVEVINYFLLSLIGSIWVSKVVALKTKSTTPKEAN